MRQKALYTILRTLDSTENGLKGFARYALPTKVKRNEPLQRLVAYIMKHRKTLTIDTLDLPTVFSIVYSDEPYSERKIGDLYNRLAKKITEYFVQLGLEGNNHLKILLRAAGLRSVGFDSDAIRVLEQNLDVLPEEEAEHYLTLADYHEKLFERPEKNLKDSKKRDGHLAISLVAREKGVTIKRLKDCCIALKRNLISGNSIENEIKPLIQLSNLYVPYKNEVPLIRILALTFYFLQKPTINGYFELKNTFFDSLKKLKSEHKVILNSLIHGLNVINIEDRLPEYFALYKTGITHGFLFEGNGILPNDFNNIVIIACEIGEADWAEQFMGENYKHLNIREEGLLNMKSFHQCFLHFSREKYNEVLNELPSIIVEDQSYGIHKHALLIRCTYELDKHQSLDELLRQMNTFQAYLKYKVKQKILSEELKNKNFNSLEMLRKIARFPYSKMTKKELHELYEKIKGNLVYGRWLKKKINEL